MKILEDFDSYKVIPDPIEAGTKPSRLVQRHQEQITPALKPWETVRKNRFDDYDD
jgi:hypothetical protein